VREDPILAVFAVPVALAAGAVAFVLHRTR
jgi:hypothetical protein